MDGVLSLPAGKFDYRNEPLEGCEPRANEAAVSFSSIGCLRGLSFVFSGFPASPIQSKDKLIAHGTILKLLDHNLRPKWNMTLTREWGKELGNQLSF